MLWDAMHLQQTFHKFEGLETEGCLELFLGNVIEAGDVHPSLCRIESATSVFF